MSAASVLLLCGVSVVGFVGGERGVSSGGIGFLGGRGAGAPVSAGRPSGMGAVGGIQTPAPRMQAPLPRVQTPAPRIQTPAPTPRLNVPAPSQSSRLGGDLGSNGRSIARPVPSAGNSSGSINRDLSGRLRTIPSDGSRPPRAGEMRDTRPRSPPADPTDRDPLDLPRRSAGGIDRGGTSGQARDILGSGRNPYTGRRDTNDADRDGDVDEQPSRGRARSIVDPPMTGPIESPSSPPRRGRDIGGTGGDQRFTSQGGGHWSSCNCFNGWSSGHCSHHSHSSCDPWFGCGAWFGFSWGYFFCSDVYNPWCWYYRPYGGYPIYVYYPYPYPTYSYVALGYVDESRAYPALPTESYIDPAADLDALVEQGRDLFRKGDYMGAAEAFRQAILKDLNDPIAKFGYAHALFALGNYPFAALALRLGMKLLPEWPILGGDLRDLYGNEDDFNAHVKALDQYLTERPDDPAALLVAGYVHYFSGNLDRAEPAFEHLIELDQNDPVAQKFVEAVSAVRSGQAAPAHRSKLAPVPGTQPTKSEDKSEDH
jgi:hypothetical protein